MDLETAPVNSGLYQHVNGTVYKHGDDGSWKYLSPVFGEWLRVIGRPDDNELKKYPRNLNAKPKKK